MIKLDELTKSVWREGRAVSLNEIAYEDKSFKTISQFCDSHVLTTELKADLTCSKCGKKFRYVHGNKYLACSCGNQINTTSTTDLTIFRFLPNYLKIIEIFKEFLTSTGFHLDDLNQFPVIEFLKEIGTIKKTSSAPLRLFLATKQVDSSLISKLWIRLLIQQENAVIILPSLSKEAEEIVNLTVTSIPILFCDLETIVQPDLIDRLGAFLRFREDIEERLQRIKASGILNLESTLDDSSTNIANDLEELARRGREQFEKFAIPMLHTLGAPRELEKRPFTPDGILLLPKGYWIVDTKSSEKGFEFNVDERDKAIRYISNLEKELGQSEPDWRFHGEIILALTSHINSSLMHKVNDQYSATGLYSSIVILSFEGIQWLWNQAKANASYWHLFNKERDTDDLMNLRPNIRNRLQKNDISWEFATSKVRIVSVDSIKALWKHVFERDIYFGYKGRHPDYVATSVVQQTYVDSYMRLKT